MSTMGGAIAGGIAAGAAGSLVGGIMGQNAAEEANARAQALREAALNIANSLQIPTAEAEKLVLESPELVWEFLPEEEKAIQIEKSRMGEIAVDPRLKQAQLEALTGMRERALGEGLTSADIAEFEQLRRKTGAEAEARDARILQSMAERGILGSGAELASRQASNQAAMLAQAEQADRIAQAQAQAKLAALGQLGTMGTQMRSQEFGEEAQKASAEDIIAQFNALQQAGVQQRNVGARNIAEQTKQGLAQQLEAERVNAANQAAQWQAEAAGRKFSREAQKAGLQMGALTGQATAIESAGANKAAGLQKLGSGLADIALGGAKAYAEYGSKSSPQSTSQTTSTIQNPNEFGSNTSLFGTGYKPNDLNTNVKYTPYSNEIYGTTSENLRIKQS